MPIRRLNKVTEMNSDQALHHLISTFERMVRRDGGTLALLEVADGVARIGYRSGINPSCEAGACVLPHLELQELMNETLARQNPGLRVVVIRQ